MRAISYSEPTAQSPERGFSLLELIVSMAILSVGVMGAIRLFPIAARAGHGSEMVTRATLLASHQLESVKLAGYDALASGTVQTTGAEDDFTWQLAVADLQPAGVPDDMTVRQVWMTVAWADRGQERSVVLTTFIGP